MSNQTNKSYRFSHAGCWSCMLSHVYGRVACR